MSIIVNGATSPCKKAKVDSNAEDHLLSELVSPSQTPPTRSTGICLNQVVSQSELLGTYKQFVNYKLPSFTIVCSYVNKRFKKLENQTLHLSLMLAYLLIRGGSANFEVVRPGNGSGLGVVNTT